MRRRRAYKCGVAVGMDAAFILPGFQSEELVPFTENMYVFINRIGTEVRYEIVGSSETRGKEKTREIAQGKEGRKEGEKGKQGFVRVKELIIR
jgi:hypothetical protein